MNPPEILPAPEIQATSEHSGSAEMVDEKSASTATELQPSAVLGRGVISATAVNDAQSQLQQGTFSSTTTSATVGGAQDPATPMTAEDSDLIEKEWVLRAKAIVAATIGDPHAQNIQLNRMKADYISKRFQKDVKVKES